MDTIKIGIIEGLIDEVKCVLLKYTPHVGGNKKRTNNCQQLSSLLTHLWFTL